MCWWEFQFDSIPQNFAFNPPKGWFPHKLYHATIHCEGIMKEGLLSNEELHKKGNVSHGIGGRRDEYSSTISFTLDKELALNIVKDLQVKLEIVKGNLTAQNIIESLDQRDKTATFDPREGWIKAFKHEEHYPPRNLESWTMLQQGYIKKDTDQLFEYANIVKYDATKRNIERFFGDAIVFQAKDKDLDADSKIEAVFVKGLKYEIIQELYTIWAQYYLFYRGKHGGRLNPVIESDPYLMDHLSSTACLISVIGYLPFELTKENYEDHTRSGNMLYTISGDWFNLEVRLVPSLFTDVQIEPKI